MKYVRLLFSFLGRSSWCSVSFCSSFDCFLSGCFCFSGGFWSSFLCSNSLFSWSLLCCWFLSSSRWFWCLLGWLLCSLFGNFFCNLFQGFLNWFLCLWWRQSSFGQFE